MFKRIVKFLIIAAAVAFVVLALASAILRLLFPPERLKEILIGKLESTLRQEVTIADLSISILGGVSMDSLVIGQPPILQVSSVEMRYRLLALLRRRIEVTKIAVSRPKVSLWREPDGRWNLLNLMPKEATAKVPREMDLPLAILLRELLVDDFSVEVRGGPDMVIGGLDILLKDLSMDSIEDLRAEVSANNDPRGSFVRLTTPLAELRSRPRVDLSAQVNVLGQSRARFLLALDSLAVGDDLLPLKVAVDVDLIFHGPTDVGRVVRLAMVLNDVPILLADGDVSDVRTEPKMDVTVGQSLMPLSLLATVAERLVPGIGVEGFLSLSGSAIRGTIRNPYLQLRMNVSDGEIHLPSFGLHLWGIGSKTAVDGPPTSVVVRETVAIDSIAYALGDTFSLTVRGIAPELSARLDSSFLPIDLSGNLSVADLIGGEFEGDLSYQHHEKVVRGRAVANGLQVQKLPQRAVSGEVDVDASVMATSIQEISGDLILATTTLSCHVGQDTLDISPVSFHGHLQGGFESYGLRKFSIDSLVVEVPKTSRATLDGEVRRGEAVEAEIRLADLTVDLAQAFAFVPTEVLPRGLRGMAVSGTTSGQGRLVYSGESTLAELALFTNMDIRQPFLPDLFGLRWEMDIKALRQVISCVVDAHLDSLCGPALFPEPVQGVHVNLAVEVNDVGEVQITQGVFDLGRLNTVVTMSGSIVDLRPDLAFDVNFSSLEPIRLADNVMVEGTVNATAHITSTDSTVWQMAAASSLSRVSLFRGPIAVEGINGHFSVDQALDIETRSLVRLSDPRVFAEQAVLAWDPLVFILPGERASDTISVDRIGFRDLNVDDLWLAMSYEDNVLTIPDFGFDLLDGNAAGQCRVDLGRGSPEDVRFQIHAQLSGVNFARLTGGGREGDARGAEVCANMAFTGRGIDIRGNPDIDGELNITKIGRGVADRILNFLDPGQTNASIVQARELMELGGSPRWISFKIRHGNVYPSLYLDQANFFTKLWYFITPWRYKRWVTTFFSVEQPIGVGRLPLSYLLQQMQSRIQR